MLEVMKTFPDQFVLGWQLAQKIDFSNSSQNSIGRLFLVGLGGSSLPGDLINDYVQLRPYMHRVRDYQLPDTVQPQDFVMISSFSGNTEETLACLEDARSKTQRIVVMSRGGKLKQQAHAYQLPFIELPDCPQPRMATGYFIGIILGILEQLELIPPHKKILEQLAIFLKQRQAEHDQQGKALAEAINDRVPIIYGPSKLYGTCRFWKIKVNENSKTQSFFNVFPELNHNEMVGFTRLTMHAAIICLKLQNMHPQVVKRMQIMQNMLGTDIPFYSIELQGANLLEEMFDSLGIADYMSYYLAINHGIDPVPVNMVEEFKQRLME